MKDAGAPLPDTALVLSGRAGAKRLVMAADDHARRLGLYPGMALTKAQAMVPGLDIRPFTPDRDTAGLHDLALWALRRYSPVVAVDAPDGLVLDIAGCAHLYDGENNLLRDLLDHLRADGFEARAAVAGSWGAAHALARFSRDPASIVPPGEDRRLVLDLPIAALRLSADVVDDLDALGFETIGDLLQQPRAPLVHRFGLDFGLRLAQVLGEAAEPIDPVVLPDVIAVRRVFAEPIGAPETLARYTGKLVAQLCDALENRALGARRLDLLFGRVDNRIEAVRIGTAAPVRDVKRLTRLLCDRIETVDPGFGIDRMRLTATVAEPLPLHQADIEAPDAPDLSGLVDILSNRLGAASLYRLAPVESDVPERALRRLPPLAAVSETWPAWPRPPRLLPNVEPITATALLPDHAPRQITWRGVRHHIVRADGPERIFGEWWYRDKEIHAVRDYFRVEDETGRRFWIFRRGDGEDDRTGKRTWFMHGLFA
jgi:protein ImuB